MNYCVVKWKQWSHKTAHSVEEVCGNTHVDKCNTSKSYVRESIKKYTVELFRYIYTCLCGYLHL